jgi:hypothetical protein
MNFRKLLTYLTVGTAAVIPFAGAQNPTILQGSYISNVFGQSNFILNPNAQTNVANVTTVTATVTRSTTTPLVATSEFNVAIGTANGTATWATRAFDAGMKGQNCEARLTYRGFAATSKVHIKQGANTVATLNLTPATDPRIASINFPCGDLSTATTFVVTDTAILAGTNEIGAIYTGLATNMANVAQAETVVIATRNANQSIPNATGTAILYDTEATDQYGEYNPATGLFTAKRSGRYLINAMVFWEFVAWSVGNIANISIQKNGVNHAEVYYVIDSTSTNYRSSTINQVIDLNVGDTASIVVYQTRGGATNVSGNPVYSRLQISRFPTSSELVVTPERQNTFAVAQWPQSGTSYAKIVTGTTTPTAVNAAPFASSFATYFGGGQAVATANDYGLKVSNIPPGTYRVTAVFNLQNNTGSFDCEGQIWDGSNVIAASGSDVQNSFLRQGISNLSGVVRYTSVQSSREFTIRLKPTSATITCTAMQMNGAQIIPSIVFEPLDQPSNSALYVQGPVLGAATGAAIPSGYQGEELFAADATAQNTTSATYNTLSLALTPGVWDVSGSCRFDKSGATFTDPNFIASITNQNTNPFETVLAQLSGSSYINSNTVGLVTPIVRVRWDGVTNITYGSNNTSSNLVYIRCFPGTFTGGPVTILRRVRAVRVN